MFLRRSQSQRQRMHAPGLHRAELAGECCMHGTRTSHACHAAECLTDQKDAEMGLANSPLARAALNTHMTGVVRAIVCHA